MLMLLMVDSLKMLYYLLSPSNPSSPLLDSSSTSPLTNSSSFSPDSSSSITSPLTDSSSTQTSPPSLKLEALSSISTTLSSRTLVLLLQKPDPSPNPNSSSKIPNFNKP
ncbi:hypothetical protein QL285_068502 [Trifolium repens]|jgi:hypothetical protein|nr:hypothetical protein QL285_086070 [Trifolium repens]KAK2380843.1 hypothetical protein QL285_068502 [Trifolium repens]